MARPGAQARVCSSGRWRPNRRCRWPSRSAVSWPSEDVEILRLSALRGLFSAVVDEQVTFVNAPALAAERGVTAELTTATESPNHRSVVDVRAVYPDGASVNVAGTLSGPQLVEKIVQINGRNFDLWAEGVNLLINYSDQPGALGKIGTLLGGAEVNIEAAQLSQDAEGGWPLETQKSPYLPCY